MSRLLPTFYGAAGYLPALRVAARERSGSVVTNGMWELAMRVAYYTSWKMTVWLHSPKTGNYLSRGDDGHYIDYPDQFILACFGGP